MMKCSRQPVAGSRRGTTGRGSPHLRQRTSGRWALWHCRRPPKLVTRLGQQLPMLCGRWERRWMSTAGQAAVARSACDSTNILAPVVTQVQAPMVDAGAPGRRNGPSCRQTSVWKWAAAPVRQVNAITVAISVMKQATFSWLPNLSCREASENYKRMSRY